MKIIRKYIYFVKKMFKGFNKTNINLFAVEGLVFSCIANTVNTNNNLFATRLGASDFQISLLQGLPQLVAMLFLLPAGISTDKIKNKKTMVMSAIALMGVTYFLTTFVPFFQEYKLYLLIMLVSITTGFITMYNCSWQSYFSDVVPIHLRNKALTIRARVSLFPPVVIPLITGALLTMAKSNEKKIVLHQSFFIVASLLVIIQLIILAKIKSAESNLNVKSISTKKILKESIYDLTHSKDFLFFYVVILFFHASWFIDFTIYFVGQVKYLGLNETYLSLAIIFTALIQLFTIKYWSKTNERKGVRYSIIMGSAGFAFCSFVMIVTTAIGGTVGRILYLILITAGNFAAATIGLNIFQCLLQVLPERNKTICIALYSTSIVFLNAIFPMIGVQIYNFFGATLGAFQLTTFFVVIFRTIATILLVYRYDKLKNNPK